MHCLVGGRYCHCWKGIANALTAMRDSASPRSGRSANRIRNLRELNEHLSYTVDIAAVTRELVPFAKSGSPFDREIEDFEPCRSQEYEPGYTLVKGIASYIARSAAWVGETERSLRDHLAQVGSLVGALETIQLQRKLNVLTWILLALTGVLLTKPYIGRIPSYILGWIREQSLSL